MAIGDPLASLPSSPGSPIRIDIPLCEHHVGRTQGTEKRRAERATSTPWRRTEYHLLRKETSTDTMKEVLLHYDPAHPATASEAALERALQIYGLNPAQIPSFNAARLLVATKVRKDIVHELSKRGFTQIVTVAQPGKSYVKASGKNVKDLPKWLEIPFVTVVVDTESEIQLCTEKFCANEKIEPGHSLYDEYDRPLGTVGPVMTSKRRGKPSINVIITAGHVIPELAKEMYVLLEKRKIKLDVSVTSQRTGEGKLVIPSGPPWADEVGFLIINPTDSMLFNGKIANLNCHLLRDETITPREMRDPLAFSRLDSLRTCIEINPLLVFKMGSSTDLTMGRLVEITQNKPDGWWTQGTYDCKIDGDEWLGFVEWIPGIPFTASGDSGSLVYAVENGVILPLGIHVGSPTSRRNQSCFICLETFCLEAENEG